MVVDVSELKAGHHTAVYFNDMPIWIIHRNKEMLDSIKRETKDNNLVDKLSVNSIQPEKFTNEFRSQSPEFLIIEGVCNKGQNLTSYMPTYIENVNKKDVISPGFRCEGTTIYFDMSGRVFIGSNEKINLKIPKYHIKNKKIFIYN